MSNFSIKNLNTKEDTERKIFERFPMLNDSKVFHNYFTSYDFHENEKDMVVFWRDVMRFIYESICQSFAIKIEELVEITKFKSRRPLGLENILVKFILKKIELIQKGEMCFSTDFKKEEFYKKLHPELFGHNSWTQNLKNGLLNSLYFWKGNKSTEIQHGQTLVHLPLFMRGVEIILAILKKIQQEEDINVLTIQELRSLLITHSVSIKINP
jgi:hypothetical protein